MAEHSTNWLSNINVDGLFAPARYERQLLDFDNTVLSCIWQWLDPATQWACRLVCRRFHAQIFRAETDGSETWQKYPLGKLLTAALAYTKAITYGDYNHPIPRASCITLSQYFGGSDVMNELKMYATVAACVNTMTTPTLDAEVYKRHILIYRRTRFHARLTRWLETTPCDAVVFIDDGVLTESGGRVLVSVTTVGEIIDVLRQHVVPPNHPLTAKITVNATGRIIAVKINSDVTNPIRSAARDDWLNLIHGL